jgi:hypothetical protein
MYHKPSAPIFTISPSYFCPWSDEYNVVTSLPCFRMRRLHLPANTHITGWRKFGCAERCGFCWCSRYYVGGPDHWPLPTPLRLLHTCWKVSNKLTVQKCVAICSFSVAFLNKHITSKLVFISQSNSVVCVILGFRNGVRSSLFWNVTQGWLVRYLPTFRVSLSVPSSRSSSPSWLLRTTCSFKMGPIGCPETSVNY